MVESSRPAKCSYPGCPRKESAEFLQFHTIQEGSTAGGQNWASLVGRVLCHTCYARYRGSGSLEGAYNRPGRSDLTRCSYEHCESPHEGSRFYRIHETKSSGGRDWSSLLGKVLCSACHDRFKTRGTLKHAIKGDCLGDKRGRVQLFSASTSSDQAHKMGRGHSPPLAQESSFLVCSSAPSTSAEYLSLHKEAAALMGAKVRQYYAGYGKGEQFETQGMYGMGVFAGTVADVWRERCPRLDEIGLRVVFTIQFEDGDAVDVSLGQLASMTRVGDEAVPVLVEDKLQDTSVVQEVRRAASPVVGLKLEESCVDTVCEYARKLQVQEELAMIGLSVIEPIHSCLEDDEALRESCMMKKEGGDAGGSGKVKKESDAGFDSGRGMGARVSGPPPSKRGKVALSASPGSRLDKARPRSDSSATSSKRCTLEFCERPEESTKFYQIYDSSSAGGQDWSPLVGHTLCETHYSRFKKRGALERASQVGRNAHPALPPPPPPCPRPPPPVHKPHASSGVASVQARKRCSKGHCMNEDCERPDQGSAYYSVHESTCAGGQDWSSLVGFTLCESCYSRFKRRGTLERALPGPAKRCSYQHCECPCQSSHFHTIGLDTTSGGQDWTHLAGQMLCHSCYLRYKNTGILETAPQRQVGGRRLALYEKHCTYEHCKRPDQSYHFYPIEEGKTSGGRDWSSLVGNVLCKACYSRFLTKGTLDLTLNLSDSGTKKGKPISHMLSQRRCSNEHCIRPEHSSSFYTIEEGKTSGGRDWSHLSGQVLCHSCYMRYKDRGTLERMLAPRRQQGTEKKMICKQDHGRLGKGRARQRAAGLSTLKPSSQGQGERTSQGPSVGVASRARSEAEVYNSSYCRDRSDTVKVRPCKKPKTRHDEQGVSSGTETEKVKARERGEAGRVEGGKGATSGDQCKNRARFDGFERRCTNRNCGRPNESRQFYLIEEGRTSGGQDWGPLVGSVLCNACYLCYNDRGTLERKLERNPRFIRRCTYEHCERPYESRFFHEIKEGYKDGGQDWNSVAGNVLCHKCYLHYVENGTLDKSVVDT